MRDKANYMIFAKNLRRLLDENNMQDKDLMSITGASQTAISDWLNAKKYPRIDKIERIANYFGIRKSALIEEQDERHDLYPVSELDEEIIRLFSRLSLSGKGKAIEYIQLLLMSEEKK